MGYYGYLWTLWSSFFNELLYSVNKPNPLCFIVITCYAHIVACKGRMQSEKLMFKWYSCLYKTMILCLSKRSHLKTCPKIAPVFAANIQDSNVFFDWTNTQLVWQMNTAELFNWLCYCLIALIVECNEYMERLGCPCGEVW